MGARFHKYFNNEKKVIKFIDETGNKGGKKSRIIEVWSRKKLQFINDEWSVKVEIF